MFKFLEYQYTGATRDDKTITIFIECAGRFGGRIVEIRGHGTHRVKKGRHCPIQLFATPGKHHILFAILDHFIGVADAMIGGRAS